MVKAWRYQTSESRLRHIKDATARELERRDALEEQEKTRLVNIQTEYERERTRKLDLDEMEASWQPTSTPTPTTLGKLYEEGRRPLRPGERVADPFAGVPRDVSPFQLLEGLDRPRQVVKEKLIEPIVPDFSVTVPSEVVRGVAAGTPLVREAQQVAGLLGKETPEVTITDKTVAEAASWVLDPYNVLPGIGFGPDIMRAARKGAPALKTFLKGNPKAMRWLDDAMRAGERGGGKIPVGPEDVTSSSILAGQGGRATAPSKVGQLVTDAQGLGRSPKAGGPVGEVVKVRRRDVVVRWADGSEAIEAPRGLAVVEPKNPVLAGKVGPEDVTRVTPEEPVLGGFPERFKGKARKLEGGPPKEPPKAFRLAAGEEPPDWYSTILRVAERMPQAQKIYKNIKLARRADMTKRTRAAAELLDQNLAKGMSLEDARSAAKSAYKGEMSDIEFAEAFVTTPQEIAALNRRGYEYFKETGRFHEWEDAIKAIENMAEKRVPRPHEGKYIRRIWGNELADAIERAAKDKDWWDTAMELWMFPKAVRSSFDISFPARQGIMVSARHPLMWLDSIKTAARAWVDPDWMMRETRKLLDDPTMIPVKMPDGSVQDMRMGDLFGDMGVIAETVEPFYKSDLAQKLVPGVRRSQVSFTGAGNRLRADMTRHWLNVWKRSGVEITPQRLQRLGSLMNALSGRATIPRGWLFEVLQATWWSPQYRLSGPQAFLTATAGWGVDPRVAGIATQNLVAFVGGGIGILSMLKASGLADVELDPRSADFGKIQLGPTRINFWGSSQLLVRTIAQSITTTRIDPQLGPQTIDPGEPWKRYWQSGASPEFSLITDYATGETYLGESLRPSEERGITMGEVAQREFGMGGQRWMPLAWLDIKEGIEQDAARGGLVGGLGMVGIGVQSYEPRAAQELQTIPEFKYLDVMQIQELKDFWGEVKDLRERLEEEDGVVVGPEKAIRALGEAQGKSPAFIDLAVALRAGTSTRKDARNPDYIRFIVEHADEIREDKPELITQEIRLLLHEMGEGQQAAAR